MHSDIPDDWRDHIPPAPNREAWKQALIEGLQESDPGAHIETNEFGITTIDGKFDLDFVADYFAAFRKYRMVVNPS